MSFRGALIRKTSDQSISNGTFTTLSWGAAIYDTDSFWASGANSRLTIPAGVSAVQLTAGVRWAGVSNTTFRITEALKSGVLFRGGAGENYGSPFGGARTRQSVPTAPVQVSEGDYFEWRVWQDSGGTRTVEDVEETFASVRVIESLRGALVYRTSDYGMTPGEPDYIPWQAAEYDTDSIWDPALPTRLTPPSGSTRVILYGGLIWASGSGPRFINVHGNSSSFPGSSANEYTTPTGRCRQAISSSIVDVSPGDYFEILARADSGAGIDIENDGGSRTYFGMEVLA